MHITTTYITPFEYLKGNNFFVTIHVLTRIKKLND